MGTECAQIVNSQDMPVDIIMPRRHFVHKLKSVVVADSRLCRLLAEATLAVAFELRSYESNEYNHALSVSYQKNAKVSFSFRIADDCMLVSVEGNNYSVFYWIM